MDKEKYIEVEVPVRKDAQWFKQLKSKMTEHGVNVKWQNGHFHITVAFITDHPQFANLFLPMTHSVAWKVGPFLTFDNVDAFTTRSGQHIVYLTSSNPTHQIVQQEPELDGWHTVADDNVFTVFLAIYSPPYMMMLGNAPNCPFM